MKKAVIVAATAALLAGSALAQAASPMAVTVAQNAPAAQPATPPAAQPAAAPGERPAREERFMRRFEKNITDLKASLKLTDDQQKLWPAFETALRDAHEQRLANMSERRAQRQAAGAAQPDPVARMRDAAARMTANAAGIVKLADALGPLYATFDDAQKKAFEQEVRQSMGSFFAMPHPPRGEHPRRG